MIRYIYFVGVIFAVGACQSTDLSFRQVDPSQQVVSLYSSDDPGSALRLASSDTATHGLIGKMEQKLKTKPNDVRLLENLSSLYLASGDVKNAELTAKKTLRYDIKNKVAPLVLAQVAFKKGNFDLAAILLNNIGAQKSQSSQVHNLLAMLALKRNQSSKALSLFKSAIKLNPKNLSARMNLGTTYLKYRQVAKASVQFERILKIMPGHLDAKTHLAISKASRGQNSKARDLYEEVQDKDPENPLVAYNLAVLDKQEKKYEDAIAGIKVYLKASKGEKQSVDHAFKLLHGIEQEMISAGSKKIDESTMTEMRMLASRSKPRVNSLNKAPRTASATGSSSQPAVQKPKPQPKAETIQSIEDLEKALLD